MRRWLAASALALAIALGTAQAAVLRWANSYDVRSLDPYAGQEVFLRSFDANIYEPLVRRGRDLALEPALAANWRQIAPDRWRFALRPRVLFHDGAPFTADDVVFSFARARAPSSKIAGELAAVKELRKIDDRTVEIVTNGPDPLLLDQLSQWPIMNRAWCEAHEADAPADLATREAGYAGDHADGTGPFMVEERVPNQRTVLVPNPHWWDKREDNLDRAVFTPIADPEALVAGLESGALDMIYDVRLADIDRIAHRPGLKIVQGPGLTTIFLGFDQWRDQLLESSVTGRNPFKDRRVREAFAAAIDEQAIIDKVMRGHATPAGLLVAPGVAGYARALDVREPFDPARSRRLLAEAGYADGFETGMDCPNDRYVNDEAICQEVVAMLAKIGVRVRLLAQNRARFFAKIMPPSPPGMKTSFFLMGSTPASYDAETVLINLVATRDRADHLGELNVAGYSNPALDALIGRIRLETDAKARLAVLRQALGLAKDDYAYIPLHRQDVVWAARANVSLAQRADNAFPLRYVRIK
ncbi:MAG TPA: ABC transporter substrate-binding protein [Stellaceae bacterium]|nr:ABC transporter substrate-binding protein [Stellaceae bacterium]